MMIHMTLQPCPWGKNHELRIWDVINAEEITSILIKCIEGNCPMRKGGFYAMRMDKWNRR